MASIVMNEFELLDRAVISGGEGSGVEDKTRPCDNASSRLELLEGLDVEATNLDAPGSGLEVAVGNRHEVDRSWQFPQVGWTSSHCP